GTEAQHSEDDVAAKGSDQVFEGVPTHDLAEREDEAIEYFEGFGQNIKTDDQEKVLGTGVARGPQQGQAKDANQRANLDEPIETEVIVGAQVGPAPVEDAGDAPGDQRRKKARSEALLHALGNNSGEQRHEADGHREAIPDQTSVIRCEMVIGRAECGEKNAEEEEEVGPALRETDGSSSEMSG